MGSRFVSDPGPLAQVPVKPSVPFPSALTGESLPPNIRSNSFSFTT